MKKAAIIISLILSVIMLVLIIGLGGKIDELSSRLMNTQNYLTNRISELEYSIEQNQKEEASILSSYDWSYLNEDRQNRRVTVKITAVLKEYGADTQGFMVLNEKEYPMTLENGVFVGNIETSFADKMEISQFTFKDGDKVRTEAVSIDASPKYKYLPQIFPEFIGSYGSTLEKAIPKFMLEGNMMAQVDSEDAELEFKKVELSICINQKEVKRIALDKDEHTTKPLYYKTILNEEYDIQYGDTVEMYIEAVDSFNWKYRTLAGGVVVISEGETMDVAVGVTEIYNEKSELLFEDSELYY